MATQNQNPNAENQNENQENQNLSTENQQSKNFIQGEPGSESVQSGKRGLEQNDHTYEGENDVTHSPQKTGQPQNAQNESSASNSNSQQQAENESEKNAKAGYNQSEHDATPEANAKNTNASDPRESKEPGKGSL